MFFKKAVFGLALAALASVGSAQIVTQDVGIERMFGFEKYKAKNGGAQLQMQGIVYFVHTSLDIKFLKKVTAEAVVTYYLSEDDIVSPDDQIIYQNSTTKLKIYKPLRTKVKATLGPQHKGQYIIGTVVSPQSEWDFNDISVYQIPFDAY